MGDNSLLVKLTSYLSYRVDRIAAAAWWSVSQSPATTF